MIAAACYGLLLEVVQIDCGDGGEGCGFGAEAGGAEVDWEEAGLQGEGGFFWGEVSLRPYKDRNVLQRSRCDI